MKKARKSKFVIGGVALLSCVALAGVGYSSWVITSSVSSKTGNVTVTASAVEDDRITISTFTVSDSYSFGPAAGGNGYISASDSNTSEESLSVSFSFDVSCATDMTFGSLTKSYNITLALASNRTYTSSTFGTLAAEDTYSADKDALTYATSTSVTGSNTSVSGYYLAAPASGLVGDTGITIATVSSTNGVKAESDYSTIESGSAGLKVEVSSHETSASSATVTVTAAFGWGTYFGSQNPVNLDTDTKLDDYIEGLEWLYSAFGSATFTYTVGGTVQTTETTEQTASTKTVSD